MEQEKLFNLVESLLDSQDRKRLREILAEERSSDIAEVVETLDSEHQRMIFDVLDKSTAAEVLEKVDEATRAELFEVLKDNELIELISELDPDDAADVLAELDHEESREVLQSLSLEDAEQIKELMDYSEDSAGGIMDPIVLSVTEDATVSEAIQKIREAEIEDDFYSVFVVDKRGHFLGDVRIRLLITTPADTKMHDLIETDTLYVNSDTDQEEVRNLFKKNDLIVVPVLDSRHRLIGRITADRIIEVAEEEAAEDVFAMAGTDPAELETFSPLRAARIRLTWLLPCLIGTAMTAFVGFFFRNLFFQTDKFAIFMTAFIFSPMIAAISGNAGLQTSAIVVCGLASGNLAALRVGQVFSREFRIALLVAVCCGILGGCISGFLPGFFGAAGITQSPENKQLTDDPIPQTQAAVPSQPPLSPFSQLPPLELREQIEIAIAFGMAMFSAIMVSTTLGLFLPFFFRGIGLDPAISSGPLVTTANDSISVAIYLILTMLLT